MIVVRIWEGLGNQMFQYAYAKALQLRTGEKVCLDSDRMYREILEGNRIKRSYMLDKFKISLPKSSNMERKYFFIKEENILQRLLYQLSLKNIFVNAFFQEESPCYKEKLSYVMGNQYLMGWFQDEKYFAEYRNVLLREFRPKKKIRISSELRKILREKATVSIHVRRTDYKRTNNVLPFSYYQKAISYIEDQVENPYYIVFSDDTEWVKETFELGSNVIYISDACTLEDYEELLVMSTCKHNIIANSTFSWWGAWLNRNEDKIVVGPKLWFNAQKLEDNIMPKDWIRV